MGLQYGLCGCMGRQFSWLDNLLTPLVALGLLYLLYRLVAWARSESVRGKTVLITEANSGLGRACAFTFYRAGARVLLASRTEELLFDLKDELIYSGDGYEPHVIPMNFYDYRSVRDAAQELSTFNRLDLIVLNGGPSHRGCVLTTSVIVHEQIMKLNYFGPVLLAQSLLPKMIRQGGGTVAVVSGMQESRCEPYRSAYTASQRALHSYFHTLQVEHARDNIRVCICSVGRTKTGVYYTGEANFGTKMNEDGLEPELVAEQILTSVEYGATRLSMEPTFHFLPHSATSFL